MPINSFENYPMSWRPKIDKAQTPLYLTICNALEKDIKNGILSPNDKLPPQRELADFLDVNLSTITRAFKICETKGLINGKTGKGTYISSDIYANLPMLNDDENENEFINLGASHPLYHQNKYVVQMLKKLPSKLNIENLMRYYDITGTPAQKESGRLWLEKLNLHTEIENILLTSGLQNSLAIILSSLFSFGDKVVTNSVIYPGFKNIANMLGIRLIPVPYEDNMIDSKYLENICKSENIKGIYMMPDMQNPTTITMSDCERRKISDLIKKYSLIGIEDGTYTFLNDKCLVPLYEFAPDNIIHICTISNSLSAGLRISYLVTPDKYRKSLLDGIRNINVMSSPLESEIVSQLIQSGLASEIVNDKRNEIRKRNMIVQEHLAEFEILGNENCQFRWMLLPSDLSSYELELRLLKKKIKVFCSDRFLVGNADCKQAIRLAICSPATVQELIVALDIIKKEIEQMQKY